MTRYRDTLDGFLKLGAFQQMVFRAEMNVKISRRIATNIL